MLDCVTNYKATILSVICKLSIVCGLCAAVCSLDIDTLLSH